MKPRRVLVVDDSPVFREAAKLLLEQISGISVPNCAACGVEALESVRTDPPDLVLMDVSMEGMDGFETMRLLRQLSHNTPVVLMSFGEAYLFGTTRPRPIPDAFIDKANFANELQGCLVRFFPDLAWTAGDRRP